jgi:hypothetical protein
VPRTASCARIRADHFDIYDGAKHELVVADEVELLRRVLGLAVPVV